MRDIKFRAWDKETESMLLLPMQQLMFDYEDGFVLAFTPYREFANHECFRSSPNLEIMQYTGLKDKNGKEIYEGDIVEANGTKIEEDIKLTDKTYYKTVELRTRFVVVWNDGFSMWDFKNEDGCIIDIMTRARDYEVVGNIYEKEVI